MNTKLPLTRSLPLVAFLLALTFFPFTGAFAARKHVVVDHGVSGYSAQAACLLTKKRSKKSRMSKGVLYRGKFSRMSTLRRKLNAKIKNKGRKRVKNIRAQIRARDNALSFYQSKEGKSAVRSLKCRRLAKQQVPIAYKEPSSPKNSSGNGSKPSDAPKTGPNPPSGSGKTPPPLPAEVAQWNANMRSYGSQHCNTLKNSSGNFDVRLLATYYDAEWVYYQIADHTGDSSWNSCAAAAEDVYRNRYVNPAGGQVPGYWNFSHGMLQDFLRTGDGASRSSLVQLSQNASYAHDQTPIEWSSHCDYSREVAYAIHTYINAELAGEPRRARLAPLVDQALGHMDQWIYSQNAPYVRPFMVGLTAHALINYHETIGDRNMVPVIRDAMNWLWDNTWVSSAKAFRYTDRQHASGGTEPAPDLNLLIAPAFAWLYHQTGNTLYQERADEIFKGGTQGAFLNNGKQFNQNYRWSFDYIKWRTLNPLQ